MHEHTECEHELKHCKICGTVYCEKCNTEWRKQPTYSITYPSTALLGNIEYLQGDGVVYNPNNTTPTSHEHK